MYTICESGANKGHQAHSQESFALRFVYVFFFFFMDVCECMVRIRR